MTGLAAHRPATGSGTRPPAAVPERRTRVVGIDATRGVALLGMIAVHALPESDAAGQPTWWFAIFGGRASAAFAVLAGIGIAFMTGRGRVRRPAGPATVAALGVRALAIGAIGLALGYTDGSVAEVILPAFALTYLLMIPLVFLPTWTVAVTGAVLAVGAPALSHVLLPRLPDPALDNPTFGYLLHDPGGLLAELSITGEYPALVWLTYLCAGLVIGRLSLTGTKVALGLLATGVLLADAASLASSTLLYRYGGLAEIRIAQPESALTVSETTDLLTFGGDGTAPTSTWWWLAVDAPHTGTPPDLLVTTGSAIALLGAVLLAGSLTRPALRRLATVARTPLAAAGGMPLTLYTAHIIYLNSGYDTFDAATGYLVQAAAVLLIGFVWRGTTGRGPLEALVAGLAALARRGAGVALPRRSARPVIDVAPPHEGATAAESTGPRVPQ